MFFKNEDPRDLFIENCKTSIWDILEKKHNKLSVNIASASKIQKEQDRFSQNS